MSDKKKDFLGQEYEVGDTIVYAGMSGRSVQMVLARVVKFNDSGSIKVQPLDHSSRWTQHHPGGKWIDSRTGGRINPYNDEHVKVPGHYRHLPTGQKLSTVEYRSLAYHLDRNLRMSFAEMDQWRYVGATFQDHVVRVDNPIRPVTLQVTENIIKVDPSFAEEPDDDR